MKTALVLVAFLSGFLTLNSQEKKVFVIKAGEAVNEVIPFNEAYTYPAFVVGKVHFRSGDVSQGQLNYNIITAEMDFIDNNGDTLALADEPLVRMVVINTDTFYFNEGYIKLVASSKDFKLGKRSVFTTAKIDRTGAFDQPMPAGSDTYSGISNGNHVNKLIIRQNITLVKETAFYFGNKNEFLPANRKNLMRSFSKQEKKLEEYLRTNEINFRKEEELVKLIQYLQTL